MEDRQPRNRRRFTAEFKRDAVELVRTSGRPIAEIARELGIYDSTLGNWGNWVRQDRIDRSQVAFRGVAGDRRHGMSAQDVVSCATSLCRSWWSQPGGRRP